jgi:hypothetical protein
MPNRRAHLVPTKFASNHQSDTTYQEMVGEAQWLLGRTLNAVRARSVNGGTTKDYQRALSDFVLTLYVQEHGIDDADTMLAEQRASLAKLRQ